MDRRSFLRASTVGGAVAAASTLAAPAIAQERITWRMVTTWPRNFPVWASARSVWRIASPPPRAGA